MKERTKKKMQNLKTDALEDGGFEVNFVSWLIQFFGTLGTIRFIEKILLLIGRKLRFIELQN